MPQSLVMATGAGIGLFIAFIGLCEYLIPASFGPLIEAEKHQTGWGSSEVTL